MTSAPLQFGRYQIEEQLGEGGMGQTFRATQTGPEGFKKTVVIKLVRPMLKPRFGQMERFIERFRDEARIHSHLDHGNVVHLLDFGVQDGRYFIVMEYVRGMDLRELQTYAGLKGGPLPHAWVEYIIDRICRALHVAHTLTVDGVPQQLVHRDVSLSNVLVSTEGEIKLTDFGVAKAAHKEHRTVSGEVPGKIEYMSPEQLRGQTVDHRSDLFSLGVVLYVLLTGRLPFGYARDLGADAVAKRVTSGAYEPPEAIVPSIPQRLVELVGSLLQVDPDRRPQSAADIADRLEVRGNVDRELGQFVREATSDTYERTDKLPPSEAETREGPKAESVQLSDDVTRPEQHAAEDARIADAPFRAHDDSLATGPNREPRAKRRPIAALAAALSIAISWMGYVALSASPTAETVGASAEVPVQLDEGAMPEQPAVHVPVVVKPDPPAVRVAADPELPASEPLDGAEHKASATETNAQPEVEEPASEAAPTSDSKLRVFVAPTGKIWINGRLAGSDRLTTTLPPGRYVIEAGRGNPETRRVVQLKADQTRTVEMVLPFLRGEGDAP